MEDADRETNEEEQREVLIPLLAHLAPVLFLALTPEP